MGFKGHVLTSSAIDSDIEFERAVVSESVLHFHSSKTVKFHNAESKQSVLTFETGELIFRGGYLYASEITADALQMERTRVEGVSFLVAEATFTNCSLHALEFHLPRKVNKLTFIDCSIGKIDFSAFKKTQLDFVNTDTSSCVF
jgi:hypothetical protein